MENELENLLKNKMSVDALEIDAPNHLLVIKARKLVGQRKKSSSNWWGYLEQIKNVFYRSNKVYHFALTTLIIAGCIFYFSKAGESSLKISKNNVYTGKSGAISSSTTLATNDAFISKKPSVNTSTALTSIMTFVTIN